MAAQKKIQIVYDIDGKAIDVAIDSTLNLKQQVRELTKEINKTKEGTKEFSLLSAKLNETKDNVDRVNAKSREFFSTLSLLPGPIGTFANQIDGAISLLKTFSGFSLKDIRNQFGELGKDISSIFTNFLGLKTATENTSTATKELGSTLTTTNNSLAQTAQVAGTTAAAVQNNTKATQLATIETDKNGVSTIKATKSIADMTDAERALFKEQRNTITHTGQLSDASNTATKSIATQTVATETLTLAERAATFATNALKIALAGLGIGLVIMAVQYLVGAIAEWFSGAKAAEQANKDLTASFDLLKRSLSETQEAIKDQTDLSVIQAKIAGKTEEEIYRITKEGFDKRVEANKEGRKRLEAESMKVLLNAALTEEQKKERLKAIDDEVVQNGIQSNNLRIEGLKLAANEELRIADKNRAKQKEINDKKLQQNKQYLEKLRQDNAAADELLFQLGQENAVLRLRSEEERQNQELKNAKEVEERKINALKISEEKRNLLLAQVREKYAYKVLDVAKKREEDGLKLIDEYQKKKREILDSAISNDVDKAKADRQRKYDEDLKTLEADKQFIKASEQEKADLRKALATALANDIKKIDDDETKRLRDERLKKLDDELKFLQIKAEAIRAGTKAYYDNQRDILAAAEKREIEAAEGKEKEITAIKEKYVKLRNDLDKQEKNATILAIGETIAAFANLTGAIASSYDEEAKTSKEAFEKRKRLQKATAVMSAASGIIQILAQPSTLPSPFDWIVKAANAAALAIATAVQIKQINNTKFEGGEASTAAPSMGRGYAQGGYIDGPRHSQGGVNINAEGGEAIMTRGAVTMFGPLLSAMNAAGGGTSFAPNLLVTRPDNPIVKDASFESSTQIIKTYVVESELTTEQQRQARLKDLSTL